jgi:isopentenyl-diphosphate delta-isomerase
MRSVILTDEQGIEKGTEEIMKAHEGNGMLHKAFSVLIMSPDKKSVLLQQRVAGKLFGLHWANTCCSHPRPGDDAIDNATQRLFEEMGIRCDLSFCDAFTYRAKDPEGKGSEYEYDMVFTGVMDESTPIMADPGEVAAFRWIAIAALEKEIADGKEKIAPWLPPVLRIAVHGI